MKRKMTICILLILLTVLACNVFSQSLIPKEWKLDDSTGVKVWIARNERFHGGHRLLIYIEPHNYTLDNLKKVFRDLWKVNEKEDVYISIDAITSINRIIDKVRVDNLTSRFSVDDISEEARSKLPEDLSFSKGIYYTARYFRTDAKGAEKEYINFSSSKRKESVKLDLKKPQKKQKKKSN